MKTLRSALALALAFSLTLLSPGARAWAQVAEAARPAAAGSSAASAAAGAVGVAMPSAAALSIPALSPVLGSVSAPMAAPGAASASASASAAASAPSVFAAASAAEAGAPAAAASAAVSASAAAAFPESALAPAPASPSQGAGRAASAAAPLTETARALGAAREDGAKSGALDQLFLGARRTFGLDEAAPVPAAAPTAGVSGLAPASARPASGASAGVPAPSPASGPGFAAASRILPGALSMLGLAAAFGAGSFSGMLVSIPLILISLILHEIGHARVAARLGDRTATLLGRASFNPLKWGTHIDPIWTIAMPLASMLMGGFIFGGAKPVPVNSLNFKNPVKDMAKVAVAGPAVNFALAAAGALAFAGAAAAGLGLAVGGALLSFVYLNSVLGLFNLIPVRPLDGGHILAAFLPPDVSARLDALYARLGMIPLILVFLLAGGLIAGAAGVLTHLLIGLSLAATGAQLAGAFLPAVAAVGLALGSLRAPAGVPTLAAAPPAAAGPAAADTTKASFVVVFEGKGAAVSKDMHLTQLDESRSNYAQSYQQAYASLLTEVSAQGVTPEALASFNASPIATYRRINAATFALDAAKAEEFAAAMRALGHKVYPNERRKIITPVPVKPEDMDPSARNPVSMGENLRVTRAEGVHAIAAQRWGAPDMNPWQRIVQRVRAFFTGDTPAQPKAAVVDSGADVGHGLLKRVKEVKNMTSEPNVDDIGHGSWVTSMVLNYAPWAKNVTHYKTFTNGGATLDDILKSLTAAANDGNLVISNSWGSDDGDPESPDSKLVVQLAKEGHVLVFAAGNAGPGKNTIGSPAIVQYKDPQTGAIRVLAAAATDRGMKVASFSSVGPGSPKTAGQDGFAHRPDLASVGYNTEGAWPEALGSADRTDPDAGAVKAISGTSMSTPTIAGAVLLLAMLFGVTEVGPKLDAVVNALMSTLIKTGKNDADHEGGGFLNVAAAYELLQKQFTIPPAKLARYRELSAQIRESQRIRVDMLRTMPEFPHRLRNELLDLYDGLAGDGAASAEMAQLEASYPGIKYAATNPLIRFWMRLTGRGPGR